jgi:hypothetical protein
MHPYQGHASPYSTSQMPYTSPMLNNVASTSGNPHASQHYAAAYSSHYAQAYRAQSHSLPYGQLSNGMYGAGTTAPALASPSFFRPPPDSSSWYSPGNCHCTYPNCSFMGSAKSLETHRMDRHLIYPPGWRERKRKPDWDADPSLIGCAPLSSNPP